MTEHFDVYVHQDRVEMPDVLGWVVTIIRERDGRMQQFGSWLNGSAATTTAEAVRQALEFAHARTTLHPTGEHPNYDRLPAFPEPAWDDAVDAMME